MSCSSEAFITFCKLVAQNVYYVCYYQCSLVLYAVGTARGTHSCCLGASSNKVKLAMLITYDGRIFRTNVTVGQLSKQYVKWQQYAKIRIGRKLHKSTKCVSFLHAAMNFCCLQFCRPHKADNRKLFPLWCTSTTQLPCQKQPFPLNSNDALLFRRAKSEANTATNRKAQNYLHQK